MSPNFNFLIIILASNIFFFVILKLVIGDGNIFFFICEYIFTRNCSFIFYFKVNLQICGYYRLRHQLDILKFKILWWIKYAYIISLYFFACTLPKLKSCNFSFVFWTTAVFGSCANIFFFDRMSCVTIFLYIIIF